MRSVGIVCRDAFLFAFFLWIQLTNANALEPLRDLEAQIQHLIFLQGQIPALFEQGAEYDVDFFQLLNDQNILLNDLEGAPPYQRQMKTRPPLKEIDISLRQTARANFHYVFSESGFHEALSGLGGGDEKREKVSTEELRRNIADLDPNYNLNGLLTGLISLYPDKLKTSAFRLKTAEEKIQFLRRNPVSSESLEAKFKAVQYGLDPSTVTLERILNLAETWRAQEISLAHQLLSYCATEFPGENCSEIFSSGDELWTSLLHRLSLTQEGRAAPAIAHLRNHIRHQFSAKVELENERQVLALRLKEVPPFMAIFRGLVGADCSTSFSFPYAYMPQERTYFMYSADGTLLGYLMGTLVSEPSNSSRVPNFYIHTVAGGDISRRHVYLAIHGLAKAAENLGFANLLLPPRETIVRNINYVAIHEALYQMLNESALKPLVYLDGNIRDWLVERRFSNPVSAGYDSPGANRHAHAIVTDGDLLREISVRLSDAEFPEMERVKTLPRSKALLIALDLLAGENLNVARRHLEEIVNGIRLTLQTVNRISYTMRQNAARLVLEPYGIEVSDRGETPIHPALKNRQRNTLETYYKELAGQFESFGVEFDDDLVEGHPYLFYEGHLSAPDAVTTRNRQYFKRTIAFVTAMIRRWPNAAIAYEAVAQSPYAFSESSTFRNAILRLFNGTAADYVKIARLYSAGFHFENMDLQELIELAETKSKEPALDDKEKELINVVAQFLNEEISRQNGCESKLNGS